MKWLSRLLLAVVFALPPFVCAASPLTTEQVAALSAIEKSCDRIGHADKAHRALEAMLAGTPPSTLASERASAQYKSAYDSYVQALAQFSHNDLVKLCDSAASAWPSVVSAAGKGR